MTVLLTDRGTTSSRHLTDEGFLSVEAIFSCVGIQEYKESELFDGGDPDVTINAYRSAETLSDPKFLKSLKMKPLTVGHPDVFVNSSNYNSLSRGHVGENAILKGNKLHGHAMVTDEHTVSDMRKREDIYVSLGYRAKIERETGIFGGKCYTAVIKDMRANHMALLTDGKDGRCDGAKILDKREVAMPIKEDTVEKTAKDKEALKKVEDQNLVESVVEQLLSNKSFVSQILQAVTKSPNLVKQLGAAIANQSAPNTDDPTDNGGDATDTGAATPASGATPSPSENQLDQKTVVDAAVNARIKLVDTAKTLFSLDSLSIEDKSNREVMMLCINDKELSDEVSDDFVKGRFDGLVSQRRNVVDSLGNMRDFKDDKKEDSGEVTAEDINTLNKAVFSLNRGK